MEMKKFVLQLDLENNRDQQRRALKTISTLSGIDAISIDLKGKKLTMIGTVDPVNVVSKLRKRNWSAHLISVGPAIEPEKKEEPQKEPKNEDGPKKDEPKKEEAKEEAKKDEPKKDEKKVEPEMVLSTAALPYRPYRLYYPPPPPMNPYYPVHHSMEENPNACVIC